MTRPGLGTALAARLFPEQTAATRDPVDWIVDELGEELWSKQREIARSAAEYRHTAVPAANGVGKSFLASRLAAWWVAAHPIGEAIVVSTAPTGRQLDAILWAEIRRLHARARLPGTITQGPDWRIGGTLVALGRKSADLIDQERAAASFQGIHRPHVLVILDEASGIQPWLWRAVNALTTAASARALAIGNPLDPSGRFAEVCAPGSGWNVIGISAFDTPAFTGEQVSRPLLDALPSEQWIEECRRDFGEGSPHYAARVLGEFPALSDDGLISPAWVREAQDRDLDESGVATLGVDVARSGSDETAIYGNRGGVVRRLHAARGHDLMRTTGAVARLLAGVPKTRAVVDAIGIGAGVVDRLREQGLEAVPFNSAERAQRPDRFANRRAEVYWRLREELREGRVDLDPDDDLLASQLVAIRWQLNSRGQIQIESKDSMRRRGVASPDRADAVAMAMVAPEAPRIVLGPPVAAITDGLDDSGGTYADDLTSDLWKSGRW